MLGAAVSALNVIFALAALMSGEGGKAGLPLKRKRDYVKRQKRKDFVYWQRRKDSNRRLTLQS